MNRPLGPSIGVPHEAWKNASSSALAVSRLGRHAARHYGRLQSRLRNGGKATPDNSERVSHNLLAGLGANTTVTICENLWIVPPK
jgi:hypothetical protein